MEVKKNQNFVREGATFLPFQQVKMDSSEVLGDFERANKQQLGNTDRFFNVWGRGRPTPQPF